MSTQQTIQDPRARLLEGAPVTERRLDLAGVSTAVLEGGDGPPALVGASLGASIAARYAIAHPDRVSRLVLVGAGSLARFRPAPGVMVA